MKYHILHRGPMPALAQTQNVVFHGLTPYFISIR